MSVTEGLVNREALMRVLRQGRHHLPVSEALRSGLICAAPTVLAAVLHEPLLCWTAIATFWTCLSDEQNQTTLARVRGGLAFGVLGALLSACAIAAARVPWAAVALTGVVAYVGALIRTRGAGSGLRALLLVTACAVSASFPVHPWPAPIEYAACFFGGSIWAVVCMVGLWQYSDAHRARRATFAYLYAVSSFLRRLGDVADQYASGESLGRSALRSRLDVMKQVVDSVPASHDTCGVWRANGERIVALLAGLETLLTGNTLGKARAAGPLLAPTLRHLAELFDLHADAVRRGLPSSTSMGGTLGSLIGQVRRGLRRAAAEPLAQDDLAWVRACETLVLSLVRLTRRPGATAGVAVTGGQPARGDAPVIGRKGLAASVVEEMRAGGSIARYACRLSVAAMVAVATVHFKNIEQGYWLVLTALFVVQPTVSQTVKVSALRVTGTVLGAVAASLVALIFRNPVLEALSIIPLATGTFVARGLSYVSYILFLTPHFILVAHLGMPTGSPWTLAALRIGNSVAGAIVAVLISLIAWPEWEARKLTPMTSAAIDAVCAYLDAVRNAASEERAGAWQVEAARRNACVAIDKLDALASAMRRELIWSRRRGQRVSELVWHLRRLVGIAAPFECIAATMPEQERRRIALLASSCMRWLRGSRAMYRFLEPTARVEGTPSHHFLHVSERRAAESAKFAGAMYAELAQSRLRRNGLAAG
ncbi:FUSC family protein [Ralstonia insidiosa]|uniref:FUSC family protein n=1 Tax=Ralstonia insidiosa TaxID=190721 RepID=UPI000CEDF9DC|nr:FUSC family protein [Ralstonia insidiosa]